jgi:two-component sensor histidine kinase
MIAYEDDGVGFPEGFEVNETGHMGMNFIRLLSAGLDGHHEWQSDSLGVRFEIVLPLGA